MDAEIIVPYTHPVNSEFLGATGSLPLHPDVGVTDVVQTHDVVWFAQTDKGIARWNFTTDSVTFLTNPMGKFRLTQFSGFVSETKMSEVCVLECHNNEDEFHSKQTKEEKNQ